MTDLLSYWPVLLFWPPAGLSLLAASLGLFQRRASLVIAAAIVVLPPSLYLAATPRLQYVGLLPVVAYLVAARTVRGGPPWLARGLVAGVAALFGWLALIVLSEVGPN